MLRAVRSAAVGLRQSTRSTWRIQERAFRATPTLQLLNDDDAPDFDDDAGGSGGGHSGAGVRVGRPFLDPRAPRRQESIRSDARHSGWGGMIDILEHAAYCDGQREEDPDGFFFDETRAEYCSDCDGDPFCNGYLTEDEIEFSEEYQPQPYIPSRVVDQVYFLYSVRGYTVQQLAVKYKISSERISAMINLKASEPEMIAAGKYSTQAEVYLLDLYRDGQRFKENTIDNWAPDYDMGVNYNILSDDQLPDDVTPIRRRRGVVLRSRHSLKPVTPPPRDQRLHKSRFVFRDVSGRRHPGMYQKQMKLRISDFNGEVRPANNLEALYRSWETRAWSVDKARLGGATGLPFSEDNAKAYAHDEKKGYRLSV